MTEETMSVVSVEALKGKLESRTITESELRELIMVAIDTGDYDLSITAASYGKRQGEALKAIAKLASDEAQVMDLHPSQMLEVAKLSVKLGYAGAWIGVVNDALTLHLMATEPRVAAATGSSGSRVRVNDFSQWRRLPESAHRWKVRKLIMDHGTDTEKASIDTLPAGYVEGPNSTSVIDKHRHNLARNIYDRLVTSGADPAQLEADYTRVPGRS